MSATEVVLLVVLVCLLAALAAGLLVLMRRVLPDMRAHRATRGADFDTVVAEHIERRPVDGSGRQTD